MFYQFKREDAIRFAELTNIPTKVKGEELIFRKCPYCGKTNSTDKEKFAINLKTGQFKCLRASCGAHGNMVTLSKDFDFSLGTQADAYYRGSRKRYRTFAKRTEPIVPKPKAIEYLASRGISEETAKRYQVTISPDKENVLCFTFFDEDGKPTFIKYRKTDFVKGKDTAKEWCEANCKPILYGMELCNTDNPQVVLTEGMCDTLALAEAGIENPVSVPTGAKGFTWLPFCWDFLHKFKSIVIFGDYEKGEISLLNELKDRLGLSVLHIRKEDYKDCKDANEILIKYGKEYLREIVGRAECVPMNEVVDLADVEDIDIFSVTKVETGLKDVDRLLYGGLPLGALVIVTGKSGVGKSNLTSQILVHAVSQGYACFAYSGELPNSVFKAWFDLQVAGPRHITTYQNKWGDENYTLSKTNKQMIHEWYRGRILMRDSRIIEGEEYRSLAETIVGAIKQYGVKVILIDNLMTALDESVAGSDVYERQSKFARSLALIARRWEVLILLVAHKRKNNFSDNINDEVAGSSNITNLASILINYDRGRKVDGEFECTEEQRMLRITKNRLFGRTNERGWVCGFENKSKRIFIGSGEVDREYSAFPQTTVTNDGFIDVEQVELPWG